MCEIFFRTKIQAQRKFAQGQNPPASAYLTYNLASGIETPREKSPERELLPNLKPNAEDFLTFLCFRGTSSLPKELDFTNSLNQPSTSGSPSGSKSNSDKKKQLDEKKKAPVKKNDSSEGANKKAELLKQPIITEKDPKTGFMPFAVRKRAEVHPAKNDKKKLQQQNQAAKSAKKKELKLELNSSNDVNVPSRATRANPVEEKSTENHDESKKIQNKRKSEVTEEKSEKSTVSTKNIKTPKTELVPIEKVPNKDATKNKSPKKEDGKRQTRLSALKNPPSSTPKDELKNGKEPFDDVKKYFSSSSDDDEPLLKAEPKNKKQKIQKTSGTDKSSNRNETVADKSINDSQNSIKSGRGRKKKSPPAVQQASFTENVSVEEASVDKTKNSRKKKATPQLTVEKDNSQANTTDLSENETRGRPMRKTKEAATIYMELIGRKLTLNDSSDNDSSLDSLEVPNLKRVEMMEIELKEKLEKGKVAVAQKKKADEKKALNAAKKISQNSQSSDSKNLKGKRGAVREEPEQEELKPKRDDVIAVISKDKSGDEISKLEKSFSDSDEEPLATKLTAKQNTSKTLIKKRGKKSQQEVLDSARKVEEQRQALRQEIKALDQREEEIVQSQLPQKSEQIVEKKETIIPKKVEPLKTDTVTPHDDDFVKNFDSTSSKPVQNSGKSAINLLPSKEESEKIFGIASVTLAQSSGPLDTKCTLGKCGSIHKPPLGPAVLTESALGASLSPKDRRKSKVNMTREQIEKWLDEASWTPIPDDEMESIDHKITSKASTSSVVLSKSGDDSQSSILTKDKIDPTPSPSLNEQLKKPESPSIHKLQDKRKSDLLNASNETKASSSALKTPTTSNKQQPQQRRTPVYKTQMDKPKSKLTPVFPSSFGAFSPENEHSVYSFDREDDDHLPALFRRGDSKPIDDRKEMTETFSKPTHNTTPNKQSNSTTGVSLTLSPEDNKKFTSIAVDLATSSDEKKKLTKIVEAGHQEKGAGADDSDSEGHTFYIPLQATSSSGSKTIQGVAVKLGTEGSEGPNQRIIMHAKLVTKSSFNATPLPESMSNVQELVKSLMASKSGETSKPVQPVQPRFKDDAAKTPALQPEPSTSSLVANQRPTKTQQPAKLGVMSEAPIFRPTEKEFADPIEYIERITPIASRYGICRIIPPESFTKQAECRVSDEMRFTAYNQYVHKMLHRWGPSAKEFSAIKKYLATQSIVFQRPPLIAGIEVDLPRLYHTVQELGGLREVIEKKKWVKVAEDMCIPKSAHDRVTKLDDIYCKYLLPYDTLSPSERQKLFDEVEADWAKREAKARRNADKGVESDELNSEDEEERSDDSEQEDQEEDEMECMVKGRSMALSQFYRVARNLVTLWFKTPDPPVSEIETEYWRHVAVRDSHVCVHYGSIDSSGYGYGFPAPGPKTKMSPCAKHPWNLKVLTNNSASILRSLGPVMGVTVPTLHVGMLFSAVCWYRDPHGLPWIEYLHTGASKIWYAVPDEQSSNFRSALTSLVPSHCQNKTIWLPCDTTMVRIYIKIFISLIKIILFLCRFHHTCSPIVMFHFAERNNNQDNLWWFFHELIQAVFALDIPFLKACILPLIIGSTQLILILKYDHSLTTK